MFVCRAADERGCQQGEIGKQNVHVAIKTGCISVGLPAPELEKEHPSAVSSFKLSRTLDATTSNSQREGKSSLGKAT